MSRRTSERLGLAALTILSGAAACFRLRDLPVFGDEAIFLRLASLIRDDPARQLWASLRTAAAPIHFWILAAAQGLNRDPVLAGRAGAVLAGAAAVPAMAWAVRRLCTALSPALSPGASPLLAAALTAASPFFLWTERMARVDSLFTTETILVAGASLWLIRTATGGSRRQALLAAVGFGALLGVVMLTRTAVSYTLWALPLIALALSPGRTSGMRRSIAYVLLSAAVAGALFAPFLFTAGPGDLATRLFHFAAARPPLGISQRLALAAGNARIAFDSLAFYLTTPVLAAAGAAVVLLAIDRRWRLLAYLGAWEAAVLLPTMLFAGDYFSRFALPAAAPLLAALALAVEIVRSHAGWPLRASRRMATALLAAAILLWSGLAARSFLSDWRRAPWTPLDRWQLVTGWPAGAATERAIDLLQMRGADAPILVLTPEIAGNPTDSLWLLLRGRQGIELAFASDALGAPLLAPSPDSSKRWLAREDLLLGGAVRSIPVDDPRRVYFVSPDPILTRAGWQPAFDFFRRRNPGIRVLARFENLPPRPGQPATAAVVVFSVR